MDRPEAYPITYGVLGLLAFWGPMSGYDIKRQREEQEARPDRKVYRMTQAGYEALTAWQKQPPAIMQLRDELLLKILFGSFAPPDALEENLRNGIASHQKRLLKYREGLQYLPKRDAVVQGSGRPNPYATESEEDLYFRLISNFAIAFEKTYLDWLYEALALVEGKQETEG